MRYLVSSDRHLHHVADADALRALVHEHLPDPSAADYDANVFDAERRRLLTKRSALLSNLKALCGWAVAPRENMRQIDNWQLLDQVTYLYKEGSAELVPLVGTPEHRYNYRTNRYRVRTQIDVVVMMLRCLRCVGDHRCVTCTLNREISIS